MNVVFVDLRAQHDELRAEIDAALRSGIDESAFVGGPRVASFERDFARYCGSRFAVGCASGTDALKLALMAAGVRPGEAVITVPHTFIATVEAITLVGAYPIFVDVDLATYNMDPKSLASYISEGCRVEGESLIEKTTKRPVTSIIPVHLYGLVADMAPILAIAAQHRLKVVEDACQAHGALYQAVGGATAKAGTLGQIGAFSFYPGKNLGAMGEAGAVTTDDPALVARMRVWRDHGQSERYVHASSEGWNGRLDAMQAAVLSIKLRKLEEWNRRRREAANWYAVLLAKDERIVLPVEPPYGRHVYHLFVVRVPDRDRVREILAAHGISTGLHYPVPLHLQEAYRHLGIREGAFPNAETVARHCLSLPMYPHITREQVEYVSSMLLRALDS